MDQNPVDCAICLEELAEESYTILKCCGKSLHTTCLADCIFHLNPYECPFCRNDKHPFENYTLIQVAEEAEEDGEDEAEILPMYVRELDPLVVRRRRRFHNCIGCMGFSFLGILFVTYLTGSL